LNSRSLAQWIEELSSRHSTEIKLGLERVEAVVDRLSLHPQSAKVITVAGTNGKGSCVKTLEQLALAAGLRVGTLTSPHFFRFNERIRIDGVDCDDQAIVSAFELVDSVADNWNPTFFEMNVLAALTIFADTDLDIWLLEVGLGGRLDAVNVIDPDVAVITSIGLDHTDWLGDTVEKIGREKAGIFRAGIDVVLGDSELPVSVIDQAEKLGCTQHVLGREFNCINNSYWRSLETEINDVHCALPTPSVACALHIANMCSWFSDESSLVTQFTKVAPRLSLTGRMQVVNYGETQIVYDVAHNPAAAKFLARQLVERNIAPALIVFAAMADKEIDRIGSELKRFAADWVVVELDESRACSTRQMKGLLAQGGIAHDKLSEASVAEALALIASGRYKSILVCGSFFTVSALAIDPISG